MFCMRSGGLGGLGGRIGLILFMTQPYFRPFFEEGLWDNVLPAAAFEAFEVRPSRSTPLAAEAAFAEVTFLGAFVCDKALPLEALVFAPVDADRRVEEAERAAPFPVTFDFDMAGLLLKF